MADLPPPDLFSFDPPMIPGLLADLFAKIEAYGCQVIRVEAVKSVYRDILNFGPDVVDRQGPQIVLWGAEVVEAEWLTSREVALFGRHLYPTRYDILSKDG